MNDNKGVADEDACFADERSLGKKFKRTAFCGRIFSSCRVLEIEIQRPYNFRQVKWDFQGENENKYIRQEIKLSETQDKIIDRTFILY